MPFAISVHLPPVCIAWISIIVKCQVQRLTFVLGTSPPDRLEERHVRLVAAFRLPPPLPLPAVYCQLRFPSELLSASLSLPLHLLPNTLRARAALFSKCRSHSPHTIMHTRRRHNYRMLLKRMLRYICLRGRAENPVEGCYIF